MMAANSNIEWTDNTFSGWWGCTAVGPGCLHCFAEVLDKRTGGAHWGAGVPRRLASDRVWNEPHRWNRKAEADGVPLKVFASSMCDVFDNEAPHEWRTRLWETIEATPHLRWQILTKRIGNVWKMLPTRWFGSWPAHVGIMATVVDQIEADRDIPKLLLIKEAWGVSWVGLSIEPMLGPIILPDEFLSLTKAAWVINGGESGVGARHMDPDWSRALLGQCRNGKVPFFMKQMTGKGAIPDDLMVREYPDALR